MAVAKVVVTVIPRALEGSVAARVGVDHTARLEGREVLGRKHLLYASNAFVAARSRDMGLVGRIVALVRRFCVTWLIKVEANA